MTGEVVRPCFTTSDVQWLVQENLVNQEASARLKRACLDVGVDYRGVQIIPFCDDLPEFDVSRPAVPYGSTTFMMNAYRHPVLRRGLFFNADFTMAQYLARYGADMLNADGRVLSLHEVTQLPIPASDLIFIRPNDDSKSFSGEVMEFGELQAWSNRLLDCEDAPVDANTLVLIAEPKNIEKEWRFFVVRDQVVGASRYRVNGSLSKSRDDVPEGATEKAVELARSWGPAEAFVMDLALHEGCFKVIECGCINSAGLYDASEESVVAALSDLVLSRAHYRVISDP